MHQTKTINLFGGPGAGKTTLMYALAAELKKRGKTVMLAPEVAGEYVVENFLEPLSDQRTLYADLSHRMHRFQTRVDFVITDAPLLLQHYYALMYDVTEPSHLKRIVAEVRALDNINLLVHRGEIEYEAHGRYQTEEQAKTMDAEITQLLHAFGQPFDQVISGPGVEGHATNLIL